MDSVNWRLAHIVIHIGTNAITFTHNSLSIELLKLQGKFGTYPDECLDRYTVFVSAYIFKDCGSVEEEVEL
jgi:hypothetical protein